MALWAPGIISIPTGATRINVTEAAHSRNYLALRSHSGQSIINGNWVIDKPGQYEGAGTTFTYVRPSEGTVGERVYAMGPTTEPIEVYVSVRE
ncbi:hypothetical protein chiPu_0031032, partial [Chiloscyllium punctatum]|nr:hypothetical protein [Chiloscyllium punctatum]